MRVLVTGAGGNLGRVVLPALAAAGHDPIAFDFRAIDPPHQVLKGDLRNPDQVRAAVQQVDAVVHGAALHGVHLGKWPPQDFWAINATGTFNLYEAITAVGLKRVVLSSTMGVYGLSLRRTESSFAWTTETDPLLPTDVYGLTKLVSEDLARHHARTHDVTSVALRFGMYVPESFIRYGFRLLFGGVDDRDVAQAVLRALTYEPEGGFDAFNIMAPVPFRRDDASRMASDPEGLLEQYWPGCSRTFADRDIDVRSLIWGETLWPIDKARDRLGYAPEYDFGRFLEALSVGDERYYPAAGRSQWGV